MSERRKRMSLPGAAVLSALALAGCTGTHVGDDWQCPIAQGSVCSSVAAADPAVARTSASDDFAIRGTLYGRSGAASTAGAVAKPVDERVCESDCGPLAWIERLFASNSDAGVVDGAVSGQAVEAAAAGTADPGVEASAVADVAVAKEPPDRGADDSPPAVDADRSTEYLREPETIGRVWIAPWVDADGIYREGSWVRVVIAPAQWRLR